MKCDCGCLWFFVLGIVFFFFYWLLMKNYIGNVRVIKKINVIKEFEEILIYVIG